MRTSRGERLSVVGEVVKLRLLRRVRRELSISVVWMRRSRRKKRIAERAEGISRLLVLQTAMLSSIFSLWVCW